MVTDHASQSNISVWTLNPCVSCLYLILCSQVSSPRLPLTSLPLLPPAQVLPRQQSPSHTAQTRWPGWHCSWPGSLSDWDIQTTADQLSLSSVHWQDIWLPLWNIFLWVLQGILQENSPEQEELCLSERSSVSSYHQHQEKVSSLQVRNKEAICLQTFNNIWHWKILV